LGLPIRSDFPPDRTIAEIICAAPRLCLPVFLRLHRRTQIEVSQRIEERDQKQQEENECDDSEKGFSPPRIFERLDFERDDFLVRLAEIGGLQGFPDTLKSGIEDVEAARHGCYINDFDTIRSMVKTLIRNAVPGDFSVLLEIDVASFPGGVAYDAAELSYFMNREGAETIVAEENGEIVAFLILEVQSGRRRATIVTLDVRAAHRRSGYGTRLLTRAEDILVDYGVEVYDLQVDVNNAGAISFYKKHGFRTVRTLKNYYANGNDAYLMVKEL
jgi:ribosomal-protein-alanine N-acetyltransferase